ncbi:hypothetical protein GE09DRAFT_181409 [Coniochaeta sp. 2T2.1]|nr:hypothetical protein GE09DRAFT_181409 [Coniochaeta sp. 2T2.1]
MTSIRSSDKSQTHWGEMYRNTMISSSLSTLLLLLLLLRPAVSQKVFIDQVPAYWNLPECAELPLSTLVRDMTSGCGDNQKTTSFSCFCTDSFSAFETMISTDVISHCTSTTGDAPSALATSALDVFESYCRLKVRNGTATVPPGPVTTAGDPQATGTADDVPPATSTSTFPFPTSGANRNGVVIWSMVLGLSLSKVVL